MMIDDEEHMLHLRAVMACLQLIDLDTYHDLHDRLVSIEIDDPLLQALTILELATQTDECSEACLIVDNTREDKTRIQVVEHRLF